MVALADGFQLPEDLIGHILAYLDTREAARTTIVSKTWNNAWLTTTRPTLEFDWGNQLSRRSWILRPSFFRFITNTLRKYQEKKIVSVPLILRLVTPNSHLDSHMTTLIKVIAKNIGLKRLQLDFILEDQSEYYSLPKNIFEVKTLEELIIDGCFKIKEDGDSDAFISVIPGDMLNCTNLQKLHLSDVYIIKKTLQSIISRCPLIENLCLKQCEELYEIEVTKLYRLKKFEFWHRSYRCSFIISAPILQYLNIRVHRQESSGSSLELSKTEKLKYLSLFGHRDLVPSTFLDNFVKKFPQLEDLRLNTIKLDVERINIASRSLKHISLMSMIPQVKELIIDAPNMVSFELLDVCVFPDIFSIKASSQYMSKISTNLYVPQTYMDADQFYKLKPVLAKLIKSKISLAFESGSDESWEKDIQKDPVIEVEDVHFGFSFGNPSRNSYFLDNLFLTCYPKEIVVTQNFQVTRFLYVNLIIRKPSRETKWWYEDLKDAKFEVCEIPRKDWKPSTWKIYQGAQHKLESVRFRLVWKAHSTSG